MGMYGNWYTYNEENFTFIPFTVFSWESQNKKGYWYIGNGKKYLKIFA